MAKIALFFVSQGDSLGQLHLTKAEYRSDVGKLTTSGYGQVESWHGGFKANPLGVRLVYEKVFQFLDLEKQSCSSVIRDCRGTKHLDALARQLRDGIDSLPMILLGDRSKDIGTVFKWQAGSAVSVELQMANFISDVVFYRNDAEVPHDLEAYLDLLEQLGHSTSRLRVMKKKESILIQLAELGPYLKLFRELDDGVEQDHIAHRFRSAKGVAKEFGSRAAVDRFERGDCADRSISMDDAAEFCDGYGAARIIADWLVSEPRHQTVHLDMKSMSDFRAIRPAENGCEYQIPKLRLPQTDAAIVICRLAKKSAGVCAESNAHYHPGDEITIVLQGEVEFRLSSTGISQKLRQFDFIHFESEHPHVVVNCSDQEAILLSIRVLRLRGDSTRRRFWDVVQEAATDLKNIDYIARPVKRPEPDAVAKAFGSAYPNDESFGKLVNRITQTRKVTEWLLKLRKPADRLTQVPVEVKDFESLHRRVKGFLKYRGKSDMTRNFQGTKMLESVLLGRERPITIPDLQVIQKELGVPRVLLYDSLIPLVQSVSIVSGDNDWIDQPAENDFEGTYRLPCRKLLGADVDIYRLGLQENEACPINDHPGFEMLVCTSGELTLEFFEGGASDAQPDGRNAADTEPISSTLVLKPFHLCHFDSTVPHKVSNHNTTTAEVFVLRFLDTTYLPFFQS